ncbi:MAG TPA: type II toxin-antitoxin system HicA family toxin [Candidatus Methanoperedenaceae archaeon]|nr:type II toxin-antitoxin system HicA family toxin [Candidatus Methanoperedenaceae archaeon]
MPKLPVFKGKELIKFLEYLGFEVTRTKGSHWRLKSEDGRATSVPVHGNKDIPKGLLRKIIREDLEMSLEDFDALYSKYRGNK